ncbi:hypothetical protein LguiA_023629 [Lonicera macranthoides]
MKKLFFFRSSASSNENNSPITPPSKDKQVYWEKKSTDGGLNNQAAHNSRTRKPVPEYHNFATSPSLRRSLSFSSGTPRDRQINLSRFTNQNESPCSTSNVSLKQSDHRSSRYCTPTPERGSKAKWFEDVAQNGSSESSSNCSSSVSNKVIDRYIDGDEQQQERRVPKINSSHRSGVQNGKYMEREPRFHSFREPKGTQLFVSTRDWMENGLGQESPRKLAKNVIERLTQSRVMPGESSKEFDTDAPITVEDIYGGAMNRCPRLNSNGISHINHHFDGHEETTSEDSDEIGDNCRVMNSVKSEGDVDVELLRKSKEAEERAMFLSEELEHEIFLRDGGFSVPALIQTIKSLTEERVKMALEVSNVLQDRVSERASAREDLRLAKAELDSRSRRLEKEKNELQSALEKELDRRSSEWSFKLEKYQMEEHRLRERVRELAEQNVLLQREVSSFSEREMDNRSKITYSEVQLKDLTTIVAEARDENQNLQINLSELQEKYREVEENRDCIRKNYEEKEKECKELHKSITRLLRTCSEQEKTIDGLREGLNQEVRKKNFVENFDNQLRKLQMEQVRLTGVEQALRKEVESYRQEVDSLRRDNSNLLDRLRGSGTEGGSTFKLDQELWNRVGCFQNQGLSLLNESIKLCMKLLESIKSSETHSLETKQDIEVMKNGLNGQFIVESDMKLQGFKRGAENLARSLQTISNVLNEKSNIHALDQPNELSSEENLKSELKAESLLTSLLREKLYSKELDLEQLEAELSAAVRGNEILRCEAQNAMDTLSCITHKMKDLELQMIKKDENIKRLQNELQDCKKELSIMRGILLKVSEERDMLWEEVKQYSEKTMLLNCEVNALKKKIEGLDEDILVKEGQITILKDTIGKPFDLLASPDSTREFLLDC